MNVKKIEGVENACTLFLNDAYDGDVRVCYQDSRMAGIWLVPVHNGVCQERDADEATIPQGAVEMAQAAVDAHYRECESLADAARADEILAEAKDAGSMATIDAGVAYSDARR